jgi:ribosome-binding factor A
VLRSMVGAGTGVRYTPTLTFIRDTVSDSVQRMDELLARARAADADVARVREGATPAGDADPYRVSSDDDEDDDDQDTHTLGQLNTGAPTTNGEGAGDDNQFKD